MFSANHLHYKRNAPVQSTLPFLDASAAARARSEQRSPCGPLVAAGVGGAAHVLGTAAGEASQPGQQPVRSGWHAAAAGDLHAAHQAEAAHRGAHRRLAAATAAASDHD